MDAKIASYFYENGIAFNTAASSSFALMIEEIQESMNLKIQFQKFARQNPLQVTNYLTTSNFPNFIPSLMIILHVQGR